MLTLQERKPGTRRDKGSPVASTAGGVRAVEGRPGRVLVDGSCGRGANKLACLCCLPGAHRTVYLSFPNHCAVKSLRSPRLVVCGGEALTPLKAEAPPDPAWASSSQSPVPLTLSSATCPGPGPPQPFSLPPRFPRLPSHLFSFLASLPCTCRQLPPERLFTQLCDHLPAPSHLPSGLLLSPKTSSDSPRPGRHPFLSISPQAYTSILFTQAAQPAVSLPTSLPQGE